MALIANLVVGLSANSARLNKDLKKARKRTKGFGKGVRRDFSGIKRSILAAGAALVASFGARAFIRIATSFEQLRIRINTFTSSAAEATNEWERLIAVAATTQVDVDKLISSYTQLRTVGIVPTNAELRALADLAAATGLQFEQLSNIIFRGTSSTELFYNAGITARVNGEKLNVTYQGVTVTIDKTAEAIKDYLVELVKVNNFTGSAAAIANGLTGALSNVSGNFSALVDELGRVSGLTQGIADVFADLAARFANLRTQLANGTVTIKGFNEIGRAMIEVLKGIAFVLGVIAVRAVAAWLAALGPIGLAIITISAGIAAFGDSTKSILGQIVGFFYKAFLDIKTIIVTLLPEAFKSALSYLDNFFLDIQDVLLSGLLGALEFINEFIQNNPLIPDFIEDSIIDSINVINDSLAIVGEQVMENDQIIQDASKAITKAFDQNAKDANALVQGFTDVADSLRGIGDALFNLPKAGDVVDIPDAITQPTGNNDKNNYEEVRNAYANSVSRGIIDGFANGGVKGALQSFARSLQNAIQSRAAEGLADVLFGAKGGSSGGLLTTLFGSIAGLASGGRIGKYGTVHKFQSGGVVPGSGFRDTVPALLTPGELVLNKGQQQGLGNQTININISGNVDQRSIDQIRAVISSSPDQVYGASTLGLRSNTGLRGGR